MHTCWARSKMQSASISIWAVVLLCAAASCSNNSAGKSRVPDGAVDDAMAAGGNTGTAGSTDGSSIVGGATDGGSSQTPTTTSPGGSTSAGGNTGVAGTSGAGGAGTGNSASLRDGGVGGDALGGAHATGGATTSGIAGAGGGTSTETGGTGGSALGGSASGGSKPDGGIVDALDASVRTDGPAADMPSYGDFNVLIAGTWLVGWSNGDARNYSWVRLGGTMYGTAEYLSGADLPSNTPLWACDGQDTWNATAAPYAIMLEFPSSCPSGLPRYYTFRAPPDTAVAPPGATFGMVSPNTSPARMIEWWRYPDDQCDATMSTCKSPF